MSRIEEMLRLEARAAIEREVGAMGLDGLIAAVGRFFSETDASGDVLTAARGAIYLKRCASAVLAKIAPPESADALGMAAPEPVPASLAHAAAPVESVAAPERPMTPAAAAMFARAQEKGKVIFEQRVAEARKKFEARVAEMVDGPSAPPAAIPAAAVVSTGVGAPTNPPRITATALAPAPVSAPVPAPVDPETPRDFFSSENEQLEQLN